MPLIARVSHSAWPDRTVATTFADPSAAVEVFAPEGNVSLSWEQTGQRSLMAHLLTRWRRLRHPRPRRLGHRRRA